MANKRSIEKLRKHQIESGYTLISEETIRTTLENLDTSRLGLSKSDVDEYISSVVREMKDMPTEYQNPLTYNILKHLFRKIKIAASLVTNHDFYFPEEITYGTARIKDFSAFVEADIDNEDFLILLSDELFTFANLLSKSVGMLLIDDDAEDVIHNRYSYNLSKEHILDSINNNKEAIIRFTDLILAYTIENSPELAKQYTPDTVLERIASLIRESFELFIVGHEYSHILLRHFEKDKSDSSAETKSIFIKNKETETVFNNWEKEISADLLSAHLTIMAMRGNDFATSYMGLDICLIAICIVETITEQFKGKELSYSTHPFGKLRRKIVYESLKKQIPEIENIYEVNTMILDNLWRKSMEIIVEINSLLKKHVNLSVFDVSYPSIRPLLYKIADRDKK